MTDSDIPDLPALPGDTGSQATRIEQSRAIAEVQAQVVIAQRFRRVVPSAVSAMRETCQQKALADRAFFRYSRGGQAITGPTIHLARDLARIWGNINYGIAELRRGEGESEMIAYAWDVETNVRSFLTFIVPHKRDTRAGVKDITDQRDIYENNANQGARRVRECIFAVLPKWFTEEAEEICTRTLSDGGGVPLSQRVADAVSSWEGQGITRDQLERKIGAAVADWTAHDLATLRVTWTSIQRGEINKADEFPPRRMTAADVLGDDQQPPKPDTPAADPPPDAAGVSTGPAAPSGDRSAKSDPARPAVTGQGRGRATVDKLTAQQQATITRHFSRLDVDAGDRPGWLARFVGTPVERTSKLTAEQADIVIGKLEQVTDRDELDASVNQDQLIGGDQ